MTTQKVDWATLRDEDEEVLFPHHKEDKITRTKQRGAITIEETVVQKKWLLPLRKQVKERKTWAKFGEVASIPRGEHKPGDFELSNAIEIQTSGEQQGELQIVSQLSNLNTESMIAARERKKIAAIENTAPKDAPTEEKKETSKWSKMFGANVVVSTTGRPRDEFSVKVTNITSVEKDFAEIEKELNEFFTQLFKKLDVECRRMKYLSNRESKKFIGKAFFSFTKEKDAAKALEELNGFTYNYSLLEAEPADSNPKPPGERTGDYRGGDRRRT